MSQKFHHGLWEKALFISINYISSAPKFHESLIWYNDHIGRILMNPLELYKKLPRKNCGKCRTRTCMPFALSVLSGGAELSDCPLLTDDEIAALKTTVTRSDWREDLILKLREEVGTVDFSAVATGLGAEMKGDSLVITCMGREFVISPAGEISTRGHITPWMKILLLHYVRTAGSGPLSGRWTSYAELKGGMVKSSSFLRDCEEPLREFFDRDAARAAEALSGLGATPCKNFPTKNAWQLFLLPRVPVAVLFWPAEEEFPSKVKILFDTTADRFLDAESLIFLVEGLVHNVQRNS
jgi:hypothetical protein